MEDLLKFLSSLDPPLAESKEIEDWYSSTARPEPLAVILDRLVEEGKIGHKVVAVDDKSCDVYWLCLSKSKKLPHTPLAQRGIKRPFVSPLATSKRYKSSVDETRIMQTSNESTAKGAENILMLQKMKDKLKKELLEKEAHLYKLQLVKVYRSKNDLNELEDLIKKWRDVGQEAAEMLLELSPADPKPSMMEMLNYLHIKPEIIHYSVEDDSFY